MTAPTPAQLRRALNGAGVTLVYEPGWDDPGLAAAGTWAPAYVVMHHTANGGAPGDAPSLPWILRNVYHPIRAAHVLIARSGIVHVTYGHKCYHAGAGGPGSWGDGPAVPRDAMNGYAYGIEIESRGTSLSLDAHGGTDGYTPEQVDAAARVAAALLDELARSTRCALNHRTWAPGRKSDTLRADPWWHAQIREHRRDAEPPAPAVGEDEDVFVFRTHQNAKPDGDGIGSGAHYLVHSGQAVELAGGYELAGDVPVVSSPSEAGDDAFYESVTVHRLARK